MHDSMSKLMSHDKAHLIFFQILIQKDAFVVLKKHVASGLTSKLADLDFYIQTLCKLVWISRIEFFYVIIY